MRLAEAVAGVSVSAQAHCQLTAAGGLSRPTFAIANISLSVRADDKWPPVSTLLQRAAGHQDELAERVPRVLHLMWACANEAGGYHA
jgi:hypothetical protein